MNVGGEGGTGGRGAGGAGLGPGKFPRTAADSAGGSKRSREGCGGGKVAVSPSIGKASSMEAVAAPPQTGQRMGGAPSVGTGPGCCQRWPCEQVQVKGMSRVPP